MTLAEANRQFFDSIHEFYDQPWAQKISDQIRDALRRDPSWIGVSLCHTNDTSNAEKVCLLDYACGTGLMTRVLGPYVSKTRGMDVSPNMVKSYNDKAAQGEISKDLAYATVGNLLDKANPDPSEFAGAEWRNFDIVCVGLAFHHFEDAIFAARQLRARLRPGGVIVLSDFLEGADMLADANGNPIPGSEGNHAFHHHHGHGHDRPERADKHDQTHHHKVSDNAETKEALMRSSVVVPSFTVGNMKQILIDAGFTDVDVRILEEKSYMEILGNRIFRNLFFARGRNPA